MPQKECASFPIHSSCFSPALTHPPQALLMKLRTVSDVQLPLVPCKLGHADADRGVVAP